MASDQIVPQNNKDLATYSKSTGLALLSEEGSSKNSLMMKTRLVDDSSIEEALKIIIYVSSSLSPTYKEVTEKSTIPQS